jgi:hypothetical protein
MSFVSSSPGITAPCIESIDYSAGENSENFLTVPVSSTNEILRLLEVEEHMKTNLSLMIAVAVLATAAGAQPNDVTGPNGYTTDPRAANVPVSPGHSLLVYVITGGSRFGAVDLGSGVFMPIGEHTPSDVGGGLVHVQDPSSLLTLTFAGNLDAIDPVNGKTSSVGPTKLLADCSHPDSPLRSTCANVIGQLGETLYATDFGQNLYTVNPFTGEATQIGSTGIPQLSFVPLSNACPNCVYNESLFSFGGNLYANFATATRTSTGPVIGTVPQLWEINTSTGAATPGPLLVKADGRPAIGLTSVVNVNEIIYAFNAATGQVVTIDMTTGLTTPVPAALHSNAGLIGGATPVQTSVPPR